MDATDTTTESISNRLSAEESEFLRRREARRDFVTWCRHVGYDPALHHRLICAHLQRVAEGKTRRLMIFLPPGSAKSTYSSRLFPAFFLAQAFDLCILACSHSTSLVEGFGRFSRNLVDQQQKTLGYALRKDTQAAGEWETTKRGRYFCAGVGSRIAGHRADLGLIDDPVGSIEDADSLLMRDKAWDWYEFDFEPRLKPRAAVVLIQTRWHEDDLAGRILARRAHEHWEIVRVPMIAEDNDPLGRAPGELLWPEWFTQDMVETARKNPRKWNGPYQQNPTPDEGDFFKRDDLQGYEPHQLPSVAESQCYYASDHACSEESNANKTCMGGCRVDKNGNIYVLPRLFWKRAATDTVVEDMLTAAQAEKPLIWRAEKGHISKSIGPFLRLRIRETGIYFNLEECTPSKDKPTRARAAQAMTAARRVFFPKFASWWPAAEHELLTFPVGTDDDFVDMLAHLCNLVDRMFPKLKPREVPAVPVVIPPWRLTLGTLKRQHRDQERHRQLVLQDN